MASPKTRAPAKKTAPAAKKSTTRKADPDELVDAIDPDDEGDELPERTTKRMAPGDRQSAELAAALQAKRSGEPVFAYPPELKDAHKPYWAELVNSKPHDYFNRGDIPLLKLYCRAAADIDRLDEEIAEEGSVIPNARGNPVVNPKVIVRSIAEGRLMSLSTKLRAQPASRYDSENDRKQSVKKSKADSAAKALDEEDAIHGGGDDDETGLLATTNRVMQ